MLVVPSALVISSDAAVAEGRGALHVVDLAELGDLTDAAGQLRDDLVLERADLVDLDRRRAERHAPGGGVLRFVDDLGHVQQRLRRDAAAVEADTAGVGRGVDERDLHAAIGGIEGGGISAGTGADDDELSGS